MSYHNHQTYPVNTKLSQDETVRNLINRNYEGFTFKTTVDKHLVKMKRSIEESINFCIKEIDRSETVEEKDYWSSILNKVKQVIPTPHDCNIDYNHVT